MKKTPLKKKFKILFWLETSKNVPEEGQGWKYPCPQVNMPFYFPKIIHFPELPFYFPEMPFCFSGLPFFSGEALYFSRGAFSFLKDALFSRLALLSSKTAFFSFVCFSLQCFFRINYTFSFYSWLLPSPCPAQNCSER